MKITIAQCSKDSLDLYEYISEARLNKSDMILFPELVPIVKTYDYDIIIGSGREEETFFGKPYNTYELISDEVLLKYRKQNMFEGYDDDRKPGWKMSYTIVNGKKIYVAICYDLRFTYVFNQMKKPDIIIIAGDWPSERIDDWTRYLKVRATENRCTVVGVNTPGGGCSMVINSVGDTLALAGVNESILHVEV